MEDTRSSLLSRIRDFNAATGWVEFDRLYRPLLYRYAARLGMNPEESEEITQQVMEVLVSRIATFERKKSFRAWLKQIVDNKVKQNLHGRRKQLQVKTSFFVHVSDAQLTPEQLWEKQWRRSHVLYCLSFLQMEFSEKMFKAFDLYVLREMPVAKICEMTELTPNQVYVAKSRVLRRLREVYKEFYEGLYGGGK